MIESLKHNIRMWFNNVNGGLTFPRYFSRIIEIHRLILNYMGYDYDHKITTSAA